MHLSKFSKSVKFKTRLTRVALIKSKRPNACSWTIPGEIESVGVLRLSKEFQKDPPAKGTYTAKFSLAVSPKDRKIGAQLIGLTPVPPGAVRRNADAPKVAA